MSKALEEGFELALDFSKLKQIALKDLDVIPVVVQDSSSKEVLIVAYVNEIALQESLKRKQAVFWSTSRNELWIKGATSGDTLQLDAVRVNCEQNSLLFLVTPTRGGACHTKDADGRARVGCYYRQVLVGTQLKPVSE